MTGLKWVTSFEIFYWPWGKLGKQSSTAPGLTMAAKFPNWCGARVCAPGTTRSMCRKPKHVDELRASLLCVAAAVCPGDKTALR
jgi:hypothetical protein